MEGTKKIKSMSFHQYSGNSEVETTWISLIGWHHKTSTIYQHGYLLEIQILAQFFMQIYSNYSVLNSSFFLKLNQSLKFFLRNQHLIHFETKSTRIHLHLTLKNSYSPRVVLRLEYSIVIVPDSYLPLNICTIKLF